MIPERSIEVLRAIVQDYIRSREPVGSKSLVERHSFGVSAATIRNDMALLEEEELIAAPHTSSGRVPTDKGYRLFVDRLSEVKPLSPAEKQAIELFITDSADLDDVLGRTVRLLSKLTNQVAMVQYPSLGKSLVRHIELIPVNESKAIIMLITDSGRIQQHVFEHSSSAGVLAEVRGRLNEQLSGLALSAVSAKLDTIEDLFEPALRPLLATIKENLRELIDANRQEKILLSGTANLARSESDFPGSISPVLEAIEEQVVLLRLIAEMQAEAHGVSVRIGRENQLDGFANTTVLVSGYENQGHEIAKLGLIGPTRMDYATNIAAVSAVARYLTKTLGH